MPEGILLLEVLSTEPPCRCHCAQGPPSPAQHQSTAGCEPMCWKIMLCMLLMPTGTGVELPPSIQHCL